MHELTKSSALEVKLSRRRLCKENGGYCKSKKKLFAEERAKAKRNKPMTQSQLKTYMMNYLKNQGTWKINQLKKLSFEEVKEEFDKLVQQIKSLLPIIWKEKKNRWQRKGMNTNVDENDSEDSDKVDEQEETNTGTETPINPVPVAMKTPSVATYKIILNQGA
ncbi:hypothetical protein Tco_0266675 [Tanacetum coccineum]